MMKYFKFYATVLFLSLIGLDTPFAIENSRSSTKEELIFIFQQPAEDAPLLDAIHNILRQGGYRTIQMKMSISVLNGVKKPVDYGTGFFISETGLFLTSHHIIKDAETIFLRTLEGEAIEVSVLVEDIENDIAILSPVHGKRVAHWLSLGEFTKEIVGEKIKILGYPFPAILHRPSMANGTIYSGIGMFGKENSLQISAPIHPGNSGSPILDEDNVVVGIVNEIWLGASVIKANEPLPPNLNFGIKVNFTRPIITLLTMYDHFPSINNTNSFANAEKATALVMVNTNDVVREVLLPEKGRLVVIELEYMNNFNLIYYTEIQLNGEKNGNISAETIKTGCIAAGPKTLPKIFAKRALAEIKKSLNLNGHYRSRS